MTREEKYPETRSFTFYNRNPKHRITTDCEYRAISLGLEEDYNELVIEIAKTHVETGYDICENKGEELFLKKKGMTKYNQPRKDDNTKYTGEEFCRLLSRKYPRGEIGNVIAHIGGHHVVCIKYMKGKDGFSCYRIHDTWNSSQGTIGNFYCKKRVII